VCLWEIGPGTWRSILLSRFTCISKADQTLRNLGATSARPHEDYGHVSVSCTSLQPLSGLLLDGEGH